MAEIGLRSGRIGPHEYRHGIYTICQMGNDEWTVSADGWTDHRWFDTLTAARAWCRKYETPPKNGSEP